jgi:hypothetical protein
MTKNEIVARWMGYGVGKEWALLYSTSYDWLMPIWVKFRDLKIDKNNFDEFFIIRRGIENSICYDSITEAFDELVKGIEWYNNLNNKS